jgi:ATP-dependent DNA ligase
MSRKGIMLCYPFEEKRLSKWQTPYFIQPKLDGERCRAVFGDNKKVTLLSSEENVFEYIPHINKELEKLNLAGLEFDGELYTHGMTFEEIASIAGRTVNPHQRFFDLEYHIFDVRIGKLTQAKRADLLYSLKRLIEDAGVKSVRVVETTTVSTKDEVLSYFDKVVSQGYEGFILREKSNIYIPRRSTQMMKFKPKKQDLYTIVGYQEEVSIYGEPKGTLGALICESPQNPGEKFNVGTGFSADQRRDLWVEKEGLVGKFVLVKYQHITPGRGVPRFPVFAEIVNV